MSGHKRNTPTRTKPCRAAHPQTHAQRTKRWAHGLGFVVGALGIVLGVLIQNVGFTRHPGCRFHFTSARVTPHAINRCSTHRCFIPILAECDLYFGRVIIADLEPRVSCLSIVHLFCEAEGTLHLIITGDHALKRANRAVLCDRFRDGRCGAFGLIPLRQFLKIKHCRK